jgi:hypothetical protein
LLCYILYDANICAALTSPNFRWQTTPRISVSIFYAKLYKSVEAGILANGTYHADALDEGAAASELAERAVAEGTDLRRWLRGLDVFVSVESPLLATFSLARAAGVHRSILVTNADWSVPKELRAVLDLGAVCLWTKGPSSHRALRTALRLPAETPPGTAGLAGAAAGGAAGCVDLVPWAIPDPVVARPPPPRAGAPGPGRPPPPVTFLMVVGMGGVQSRRGVDLALAAFHRALAAVEAGGGVGGGGGGGEWRGMEFVLSTTLFPFPVDEALLDHPNVSVLYQVRGCGPCGSAAAAPSPDME